MEDVWGGTQHRQPNYVIQGFLFCRGSSLVYCRLQNTYSRYSCNTYGVLVSIKIQIQLRKIECNFFATLKQSHLKNLHPKRNSYMYRSWAVPRSSTVASNNIVVLYQSTMILIGSHHGGGLVRGFNNTYVVWKSITPCFGTHADGWLQFRAAPQPHRLVVFHLSRQYHLLYAFCDTAHSLSEARVSRFRCPHLFPVRYYDLEPSI